MSSVQPPSAAYRAHVANYRQQLNQLASSSQSRFAQLLDDMADTAQQLAAVSRTLSDVHTRICARCKSPDHYMHVSAALRMISRAERARDAQQRYRAAGHPFEDLCRDWLQELCSIHNPLWRSETIATIAYLVGRDAPTGLCVRKALLDVAAAYCRASGHGPAKAQRFISSLTQLNERALSSDGPDH